MDISIENLRIVKIWQDDCDPEETLLQKTLGDLVRDNLAGVWPQDVRLRAAKAREQGHTNVGASLDRLADKLHPEN